MKYSISSDEARGGVGLICLKVMLQEASFAA
jgi:hypothetical protein